MVDVPTYQEDVTAAPPPPLAYSSLPASAFGASITQALGGVADDTQQAAGFMDHIAELHDEAAATNAVQQYSNFSRTTLRGDGQSTLGYLGLQNADALTAAPQVGQSLGDQRDAILATAQNNRQKLMMTQALNAHYQSDMETVASHAQTQTVSYYTQAKGGAISDAANQYAAHMNTGDYAGAQPFKEAAIQQQMALDHFQGISDPHLMADNILGLTTKLHSAVIDGMLAQGNIHDAMAYFGQNQGEMDATTRASVGAKVNTLAIESGALNAADTVANTGSNAGGPGVPANAVPIGANATGPMAQSIRDGIAKLGGDANEQQVAVLTSVHESSLGQNMKNPQSSSAGLFGFTDKAWADQGGGQRGDMATETANFHKQYASVVSTLTTKLGRPPNAFETYFGWQQGATGAATLLAAPPEVNAIAALAPAYNGDTAKATRAIVENGGSANMTAGQFVQAWSTLVMGNTAQASKLVGAQVNPTTGQATPLGDEQSFVDAAMSHNPQPDNPMAARAYRTAAISRYREMHASQTADTQAAWQAVNAVLPTAKSAADLISMVGADAWNTLKPTQQNALTAHFDNGGFPKASDPATYASLVHQSAVDPHGFATASLPIDKLSGEDWHKLVGDQAEIVKNGSLTPEKAVPIAHAMELSARLLGAIGVSQTKNPGQLAQFQVSMQRSMDAFRAQNQKEPSDEDLGRMADGLMLRGGWNTGGNNLFGQPNQQMGRVFQAPAGAPVGPVVPDAAEKRIRADFQTRYGRQPNPSELGQAYTRMHAAGIFTGY